MTAIMNWRILTLLLIAANFIYWAWNTWIYEPQKNLTDHRFESGIPELMIVSEVLRKADSVSNELVESSLVGNSVVDPDIDNSAKNVRELHSEKPLMEPVLVDSGVHRLCHRVGYFEDEGETNKARLRLESEGIKADAKKAFESVFAGYWVHLQAYPNTAAAAQVVDALKEKNIQDLFLSLIHI